MGAATNVNMSSVLTPNSSDSRKRLSAAAPASPATMPIAVRRSPSPRTRRRMSQRSRSERHANAELARPLLHREGEHAGDADGGEHHRDRREDADELRAESRT